MMKHACKGNKRNRGSRVEEISFSLPYSVQQGRVIQVYKAIVNKIRSITDNRILDKNSILDDNNIDTVAHQME